MWENSVHKTANGKWLTCSTGADPQSGVTAVGSAPASSKQLTKSESPFAQPGLFLFIRIDTKMCVEVNTYLQNIVLNPNCTHYSCRFEDMDQERNENNYATRNLNLFEAESFHRHCECSDPSWKLFWRDTRSEDGFVHCSDLCNDSSMPKETFKKLTNNLSVSFTGH